MTEMSSFIVTIIGLVLFVVFPVLFVTGSIFSDDDEGGKTESQGKKKGGSKLGGMDGVRMVKSAESRVDEDMKKGM